MVIKLFSLIVYIASISLLLISFYWHQKFKNLLGTGRIYAIEKANIKFKGTFVVALAGLLLVLYTILDLTAN